MTISNLWSASRQPNVRIIARAANIYYNSIVAGTFLNNTIAIVARRATISIHNILYCIVNILQSQYIVSNLCPQRTTARQHHPPPWLRPRTRTARRARRARTPPRIHHRPAHQRAPASTTVRRRARGASEGGGARPEDRGGGSTTVHRPRQNNQEVRISEEQPPATG